MLSVVFAGFSLFITSCRKSDGFDKMNEGNYGSDRLIVDYLDVESELKWIARSLPTQLAKPSILIPPSTVSSVRMIMEGKISQNDFWQTHLDVLADELDSYHQGYDLTLETVDILDIMEPNHDFSHSNLYGFTLNSDDFKTFLYIPDFDIVDKNNTLVVIPALDQEIIYGYFATSPTTIDSVLVSEDNMDDYYLWVVDAETDYPSTSNYLDNPKPTRCVDNGNCEDFEDASCVDCQNEPCNNNGVCESWEDYIHCEDCNKTYSLRIKSLTFKKDKHEVQDKWLENWLSGKYELSVAFRHVTNWPLSMQKRDTYEKADVFSLLEIKRKNVCREKGNNTSRGCNGTPTTYYSSELGPTSGVLTNKFRELDQFIFILFEDDSKAVSTSYPKRVHFGNIEGSNYSYQLSWNCVWYGYPYGSNPVPTERVHTHSKSDFIYEPLDKFGYVHPKAIHMFAESDSSCHIRTSINVITMQDFINNEMIIDNDYVNVVLEVY